MLLENKRKADGAVLFLHKSSKSTKRKQSEKQ